MNGPWGWPPGVGVLGNPTPLTAKKRLRNSRRRAQGNEAGLAQPLTSQPGSYGEGGVQNLRPDLRSMAFGLAQ